MTLMTIARCRNYQLGQYYSSLNFVFVINEMTKTDRHREHTKEKLSPEKFDKKCKQINKWDEQNEIFHTTIADQFVTWSRRA